MKVELNTSTNTGFHAKVSPQLEKLARDFINKGGNRIKNNYKLNNKIAEIDKYGYDEYTLAYVTKHVYSGNEYSLVAIEEGQPLQEGTFIFKKDTLREFINYFLNLRKAQFIKRMKEDIVYGE